MDSGARSTSGNSTPVGPVHIRGLDGIRGVAVLAVLFQHLTYGQFPGGFLGVELFFVLSGYLITFLLIAEKKGTGSTISLRRFYARRALRLLPALVLTLILVAILTAFRPLNHVVALPWAELAVIGYVANWVSFPDGASLGYLGHVWSLSIEEQFYALWPLVLVAVPLRSIRERWLGYLCAGGAVVATIGTAVVYVWLRPPGEAMSYATFTHVPAILLGCLLATPAKNLTIGSRLSSPQVAVAAAFGLLALMFVARKDAAYMYLGGYCLTGILAALLIANVASNPTSWISRLFSLRALRAVGKVSYGLYLYHLPVVLFTEGLRSHGWANFLWVSLLRLILSLGMAFASYQFVERRFLKLKSNFSPVRIDAVTIRPTVTVDRSNTVEPPT